MMADDLAASVIFDIGTYKRQIELLSAQTRAMKIQARNGEKSGEISKHKSPQVKRSLGFLFDMKHGLEDINEIVDSFTEVENPMIESTRDAFMQVANCVKILKSQVDSEMLANKMASKSQYGWKTVKCFESDSLFKGLEDKDEEANTKKFKAAEFQAARELKSVKKGPARARLSRFSPYWGSQANASTSSSSSSVSKPATTAGGAVANNIGPCFKCLMPGHIKKFCPN